MQCADKENIAYQAELFKNRLKKQNRHLKKWARRTGTNAYRLYGKDIPEIPLAADIYFECNEKRERTGRAFLNISLYKRPYETDEKAEKAWLYEMAKAASDVLEIPLENIFTKIREKQKGKNQYEKLDTQKCLFKTAEGECLFIINISDYLDTGIFLDHRPLRLQIAKEAEGKKVLNLFCYTGAFSIHALKGGAVSVDSVDLSKTYLAWAKENSELNGFGDTEAAFYNCDVKEFLTKNAGKRKWDIIICDPPTFSNSKKTECFFDVNKDWRELCILCLNVLEYGGVLYFSSNSSKLKFDSKLLNEISGGGLEIREETENSIPEDFRGKKIHRLWVIKKI